MFSWAIGQSYADQPQYQSWFVSFSLSRFSGHQLMVEKLMSDIRYFDPSKPAGSRWAKAGVSTIPRMYHSSATLLMDGTVMVSGSNPNADCESMSYVKEPWTHAETLTRCELDKPACGYYPIQIFHAISGRDLLS